MQAAPLPEREHLQIEIDRRNHGGHYDFTLCLLLNGLAFLLAERRQVSRSRSARHAHRWIEDSREDEREHRLDALRDPFKLYRCHTIMMNGAQPRPKGLNSARVIADINKQLVERWA
ncbi:MAG: hypothetical protein ACM338_10270 [Betaproteobacteria bacterium]